MPHGTPDWGQIPDVTGYILTDDLAELAARLGSFCTFDRRGSVFFMDNFDDGVGKWELQGNGYGETFVSSVNYGCSGRFCGQLTTGVRAGDYARIERYFPHPPLVKLGFEISFSLDSNVSRIYWGFYGYGRIEWESPAIYYNAATGKLFYNQKDVGYTEFASGIELVEQDYLFHTAKIVINFRTGKYVRFILDDVEYEMSSYEYNVDPYLDGLYLYAYYEIRTSADTGAVSYVDNAIITRDEA